MVILTKAHSNLVIWWNKIVYRLIHFGIVVKKRVLYFYKNVVPKWPDEYLQRTFNQITVNSM